MHLEFFDDPQRFLDVASPLLAADPVLGSVIATVTERTAREVAAGHDSWAGVGAPFERWWVVLRDDSGDVVSAAMRTAPFVPYPTFSLPMDDVAAAALAAALHERGELLGGANGAATEDDARLVLAWFTAFHTEADEQAGREPDPDSGEHNTLESALVRIREGAEWLWELPGGEVVHLTGASLPSYGVSRIGPVFTPGQHRGRGIASYVVGELTRRGLEAGHRMCLFTDQANPTSNRIYAGLGYVPVVDMAEHLVSSADQ